MVLEDIEEIPGGARLRVKLLLRNGLHARPAAKLAKEAQRYRSNIRIQTDNGEADAKSMLDVLSLALSMDSLFTLEATGPDAKEAVAAVGAFLVELVD